MAIEEHVVKFREGSCPFNEWRRKNPDIKPDLSGSTFGTQQPCAPKVNFSDANLSGTYFGGMYLVGADFSKADLTNTRLDYAELDGANLSDTTMKGANLDNADFRFATLTNANLAEATINNRTEFGSVFEAKCISKQIRDQLVAKLDAITVD